MEPRPSAPGLPGSSSKKVIAVSTHDGHSLSAFIVQAGPSRDALIVFPAMGVTATLYLGFAEYCASRGLSVVLMDPRGVGSNARVSPGASIEDWVSDLEQLIDLTASTHARVHYVGHSMGGQLYGLVANEDRLSRVAFVSSSAGTWWKYKQPSTTLLAAFLMVGFIPVSVALSGRARVSLLGLGHDLPGGAASEWARWCRRPRYIADERQVYAGYRHDQVEREVLCVRVADDDVATKPAVEALQQLYPRVQFRDHVVEAPFPIGHVGFFRRASARFWEPLVDYLLGGAASAGRSP
ncbi:MAG: alpha/beta fold hydrolase [Myxococcaceae bacterium]|nr:alpha/beta fold hydrolase [Myxococcaceae bacterium]MCA3011656.1 alpha/beta fold hydrolase [Myxococcaceae bacterium]